MFIAALVIRANRWNNPNAHQLEEWVNIYVIKQLHVTQLQIIMKYSCHSMNELLKYAK